MNLSLPGEQILMYTVMKYLSMGKWWLALFPGAFLVAVVMLFHLTGEMVGRLIDPGALHQ